MTTANFTARCPVCFNELDFDTRREADTAARRWRKQIINMVMRALKRL